MSTDDDAVVINIRTSGKGVLVLDADHHETIPALLGPLASDNQIDVEWSRVMWAGPYEVLLAVSGVTNAVVGVGNLIVSILNYKAKNAVPPPQFHITINNATYVIDRNSNLSEQDSATIAKFIDDHRGSVAEVGPQYGPIGPIVSNRPPGSVSEPQADDVSDSDEDESDES